MLAHLLTVELRSVPWSQWYKTAKQKGSRRSEGHAGSRKGGRLRETIYTQDLSEPWAISHSNEPDGEIPKRDGVVAPRFEGARRIHLPG